MSASYPLYLFSFPLCQLQKGPLFSENPQPLKVPPCLPEDQLLTAKLNQWDSLHSSPIFYSKSMVNIPYRVDYEILLTHIA